MPASREMNPINQGGRMKLSPQKLIIAIYGFFIVSLVFYLTILQHFGFRGLQFQIGGKDGMITAIDLVIIISTIASFALLGISVLAFRKKRDIRIFIVSLAFFFFALKEFLSLIDNFFPKEAIFIGNAERGLEFLVLISFMMLMYKSR